MSADSEPVAGQNWSPDANRSCRNCGTHVAPQTIRGYGTNDGVLHHCPECEDPEIAWRDMRNGAGKDPEYDPDTDRMKNGASGYNPIFLGDTDDE